jgi:hypothetical protein
LHTPLSAVVAAAECVRLLCAAAGDWVRRFRVGGLVSVWFTRQVVKTEALSVIAAASRLHRSMSPADAAHVDKCAHPTQDRP